MDNLISEDSYLSGPQYQILGDENSGSQTIQFILQPQQQIVVNDRAVLYTSENVVDHTKEACKEWTGWTPYLIQGAGEVNFFLMVYRIVKWVFSSMFSFLASMLNQVLGNRQP